MPRFAPRPLDRRSEVHRESRPALASADDTRCPSSPPRSLKFSSPIARLTSRQFWRGGLTACEALRLKDRREAGDEPAGGMARMGPRGWADRAVAGGVAAAWSGTVQPGGGIGEALRDGPGGGGGAGGGDGAEHDAAVRAAAGERAAGRPGGPERGGGARVGGCTRADDLAGAGRDAP